MATVPAPAGLKRSAFTSDVFYSICQADHVHTCGVFHARIFATLLPPRHLWLEEVHQWPAAVAKYSDEGYGDFCFTEYSTATKWHDVHTAKPHLPPISGILSTAHGAK